MQKLLPISLISMILAGCVDSEPAQIFERRSGFYYLAGDRITVTDPCIHCPAGEDSLREYVSFSIYIEKDPNSERIQFYGLQGSDTGDLNRRLYPDCRRSSDCEIIGSIQTEGAFYIELENSGHRYRAAGAIWKAGTDFDEGNYRIELQGQYSYEDLTIDYDLQGEQVSFTLE